MEKIINPYIHPKGEDLYSIFQVTEKDALLARRRYVLSLKKIYEERLRASIHLRLSTASPSLWLVDDTIEANRMACNKYSRTLEFIARRIKETDVPTAGARPKAPRYDKEDVKGISCRTVLERFNVEYSGRHFKLRDERTPSCSLYAQDSRWKDYGSGEGGDVIDLYMKLGNCDFNTAIRELHCA